MSEFVYLYCHLTLLEIKRECYSWRFFSRAVGAVSRPCEKTACIQDLYVDKFHWRFFRI